MEEYRFRLIDAERKPNPDDRSMLTKRPFARFDRSFEADAKLFVPGADLETSMNTAIALGMPLLITGEPGTGKTQAAYYAAWKLGLEPVIPFQVKSDTSGKDLLYAFDMVMYFHDSHPPGSGAPRSELDKSKYVEKRALWQAFDEANNQGLPRVVLVDEIDKAPRDFPNDLLLEIDKMRFWVGELDKWVENERRELRPILFITSNSERRLPEPFLRRCIFHHMRLDAELVRQAIEKRRVQFETLSDSVLDIAVQRFFELRNRGPRKLPSLGELLGWLTVLSSTVGTYPDPLDRDLSKLPHLGVLLKDHQDIDDLAQPGDIDRAAVTETRA